MSRFTKTTEAGLTFAWGYDNPLQYYFFSCFNEAATEDADEESDFDEGDGPLIFAVSSHSTLTPHPDFPGKLEYSNSELLTLMKRYPGIVPDEHLACIAIDAPF